MKFRKFSVSYRDKVFPNNRAVYDRSNPGRFISVSLFCPYCASIWSELKWDLPEAYTQVSSVRCPSCGGKDLPVPFYNLLSPKVDYDAELLKFSLLLLMDNGFSLNEVFFYDNLGTSYGKIFARSPAKIN